MKIAISQLLQIQGNDQHRLDNTVTPSINDALVKVLEHIESAAKQNCDLICFGQWFIGLGLREEIPNKFTDEICKYALKYKINIATGTFRVPYEGMKSRQFSLMINNEGKILAKQEKKYMYNMERNWYKSEDRIYMVNTNIGNVVISHGDDCFEDERYEIIKELKPDIWVIQTNSNVNLQRILKRNTSIKEAVVERSKELNCTICVPMMLGEFYQKYYTGGSFIVDKGLIKGCMDDEESLIICEV